MIMVQTSKSASQTNIKTTGLSNTGQKAKNKLVKECPEGKVLNPKTNRCIKNDKLLKPVAKELFVAAPGRAMERTMEETLDVGFLLHLCRGS